MKPVTRCLIALAVMLASTAPAVAQQYEGVAVKSGQAAFKYAGKDLELKSVEGGLQQMPGFTLATLVFKPEVKTKEDTHLNLVLMYKAPGKVDLDSAYAVSGLSLFSNGKVSRFAKGKSKCTITLTKATATDVEGTADCPVLHNIESQARPPLTNLKFSATTRQGLPK